MNDGFVLGRKIIFSISINREVICIYLNQRIDHYYYFIGEGQS